MLLCAISHWQQCVCSGGPSISLFSFPLLLYFVIATHPFDVTAFRRYQHVVRQSFTSHSLWRWKQSHVTLWRVFKNCSFIAVVNCTPNGKKNQEKKDRCLFPTSESEARRRAVFSTGWQSRSIFALLFSCCLLAFRVVVWAFNVINAAHKTATPPFHATFSSKRQCGANLKLNALRHRPTCAAKLLPTMKTDLSQVKSEDALQLRMPFRYPTGWDADAMMARTKLSFAFVALICVTAPIVCRLYLRLHSPLCLCSTFSFYARSFLLDGTGRFYFFLNVSAFVI